MAPCALERCGMQPVGVVGAGHLGRVLAGALLRHGLDRTDLLLSYSGSPATTEALRADHLLDCVQPNETIARTARTILLTVRPQAVATLTSLASTSAAIVSCIAGVPIQRIQTILGRDVVRIMPSGPDTIVQDRGVAAIFPAAPRVAALLSALGLRVFDLPSEETMHLFTVGVCLPAALLAAPPGADIPAAVDDFSAGFPRFGELLAWARTVLPPAAQREQYIRAMCTPGGVTEAIVTGLRTGCTFLEALRRGRARSEALGRL